MKFQTIILFITFIFLSSTKSLSAMETINIAFSEYKPYMSQTLPHKGVLNDIIKQSFELEGVDVNFKVMSPTKSFRLIKAGEIDASVGWTPNESRKSFAQFSPSLLSSEIVFFYRKDKPVNWHQLPKSKLAVFGATKTYFYGEEFEQAQQQGAIRVQFANSDKINFKKLIGTRIDAFPISLDVGLDMLNRKFSKRQRKKLTFSPQPLTSESLTLMFSKHSDVSQQWITIFERGFNKLKKSGGYQKIIQNFNTHLNIQR